MWEDEAVWTLNVFPTHVTQHETKNIKTFSLDVLTSWMVEMDFPLSDWLLQCSSKGTSLRSAFGPEKPHDTVTNFFMY